MSRVATLGWLALALVACSPAGDSSGDGSATSESTSTASTVEPPTQSSDSGVADDSADFLDRRDAAGVNVECDSWAQDCPVGEKCMPWANDGGNSWNALKCTRLDPNPAKPGEPCYAVESGFSGLDNCGLASMCWNVDRVTFEGVCVALCVGSEASPHCEDPQSVCVVLGDSIVTLCHPTCDPLLQDCAGKGFPDNGCIPSHGAFICAYAAAGPDEGHYGSPCEFVNVCNPGLYCAKAEHVPNCAGSQGCCAEYCDVTDPNASANCAGAADGQVCVPWPGLEAPPSLDHVGACRLPE